MPAQALFRPPAHSRVDLISDLHLSPQTPATAACWRDYLRRDDWDALLILGDLFEVWVGDDGLRDDFEAGCAQALAQAAAQRPVAFMHGNRDFLVGEAFAARTGVRLLADPCRLEIGDSAWLLSHGDAYCLDDVPYQAFRRTVRSPAWQAEFLARPLAERRALARQMRDASEQRRRDEPGTTFGDLDADAVGAALREHGLATLIHGHTHRPADHRLAGGAQRLVLSDWDLESTALPRAEVMRLRAGAPPVRWPLPAVSRS